MLSSSGVMTVEEALRKIASNKEEEEWKRNTETKNKQTEKAREVSEQKKLYNKEQNRVKKKFRDINWRAREEEKT